MLQILKEEVCFVKSYFRLPKISLLTVVMLATIVPALLVVRGSLARAAGTNNQTTTVNPTLSTSTSTVRVGQTIVVQGQGFAPNENMNLELDAATITNMGSIPCDSTGTCLGSVTLNLYQPITQGTYPLVATGDTSGARQTSASNQASIQVGPGTDINVFGYTFVANETVHVYLGTSSGILEGTATTDATGSFFFYFTTPTTIIPGTHTVTVARTNQHPTQLVGSFVIIPPQMTNTPGIHSGQNIRINLKGFQVSEYVQISWNANGGQQIGTVFIDPTGAGVSCPTRHEVNCLVPPSAPPGSYTLKATGLASGLQATSTLNIGPGITLTPASAGPGSTITVSGGGYTAGETVNVYFQSPKNGIIPTTTDQAGAFSVSLTVPTTYSTSVNYFVSAANTSGTEHARTQFYFALPNVSSDQNLTFGSLFNFFGSGFQANEQVALYWNYQQTGQFKVQTVTADQFGSFFLPIDTPSDPHLSTVTIAGIGITSHLTATASIYEQGAVVLNPSLGIAGTKINIRGGGFGSKEAVTVTAGGGVLIATVTTNVAGGFSTTYVVPATSPQGPIFIQAAGATSGVVFQSEFYVSPQLSITPKTGPAGTVITVSGHQFSAGFSYDIYWYYLDSQSASYLTTVTADSNGNLSATINAPADIIAGHHYYIQVYGPTRPIAQAAFLAQ